MDDSCRKWPRISLSDVGQAAEVENSRQTIPREVGRLDFQYFPDRHLLQMELHAMCHMWAAEAPQREPRVAARDHAPRVAESASE